MNDFYVLHFEKEQKFVEIETIQGPFEGYLHVIDPESGTLVVQCKDSFVVLSQKVVASISLNETDMEGLQASPLVPFERPRNCEGSFSCNHLVEEFGKRLIDAQVVLKDGEKHISLFDGAAWIVPPYDSSSTYSDNETVLARLHHILSDIMDQ